MHRLRFAPLALAIAACSAPAHETTPADGGCTITDTCDPDVPAPPQIASIVEIGFIGKPAAVGGRDGAQSASLNGQLLWVFGDTFFSTKSVDGYNYRTNTAAIASVSSPLATDEPLDANGIPFTAIPLDAADLAYNAASGSSSDRVAIWNAGLVADEAAGSLIAFYERLTTKESGWEATGIGTARFLPGDTTSVRAAELLFDRAKDEPLFKTAMLYDGMVYLYGGKPNDLSARLARAPLAEAERREAYTFWDGEGWSADVAKAASLPGLVPLAISVSYNAYLGRFVGVASRAFGTSVTLRTAPRPEGPWSDATTLFDTREGPDGASTYVATQHPALERDGGRTIAVSYSLPTDCFLCGEVVLVEATFDPPTP